MLAYGRKPIQTEEETEKDREEEREEEREEQKGHDLVSKAKN